MIQLLLPFGLLGLLSIIVLIIIYIIRPNYQVKHVSSTYVWRMAMKYRKKRLPTNKLRNILIFLCQVLLLTACAGILAKPVFMYETDSDKTDVIAIIDSSASMYAGTGGDTRFLRAVDEVMTLADSVVLNGGYVSVIVADREPSFLVRRVSLSGRVELDTSLNKLIEDKSACSYGTSDIDAAMDLCEDVLAENPTAGIYLYTDKSYQYVPKNVTVVSVAESGEWNAAILNAYATLDEGYYSLYVDVACYGRNEEVTLNVEVSGANAIDANDAGRFISATASVFCDADQTKTVVFRYGAATDTENQINIDLGEEKRFYSYHSIHISVSGNDSFSADNNFDLYGGQKEVIKVQYASTDPNPFFTSALDVLRGIFNEEWDLQVTEVKKNADYATEGFDLYIFEHQAPKILPMDGAVVLMDPDVAPSGSGLRLRSIADYRFTQVPLEAGDAHPLLNYINAGKITVSRYTIVDYDADVGYQVVLSHESNPLLLAVNEGPTKIAVLPFSVHYSNITMTSEFFVLLYNLFTYFYPSTVDGYAFEVNEQITVNARGPVINFSGAEAPIAEFPATFTLSIPGTYTLELTSYYPNKTLSDINIFVKIPAAESNIWQEEDGLTDPYQFSVSERKYNDWVVYLAAALVGFLFLEWWLHQRENR